MEIIIFSRKSRFHLQNQRNILTNSLKLSPISIEADDDAENSQELADDDDDDKDADDDEKDEGFEDGDEADEDDVNKYDTLHVKIDVLTTF